MIEKLTNRELEVLQQMAQGKTNAEIAIQFSRSERTVRTQVTSILGKLGVSNRTTAVVMAIQMGLVAMIVPKE